VVSRSGEKSVRDPQRVGHPTQPITTNERDKARMVGEMNASAMNRMSFAVERAVTALAAPKGAPACRRPAMNAQNLT
jgi:hypothetical protein